MGGAITSGLKIFPDRLVQIPPDLLLPEKFQTIKYCAWHCWFSDVGIGNIHSIRVY